MRNVCLQAALPMVFLDRGSNEDSFRDDMLLANKVSKKLEPFDLGTIEVVGHAAGEQWWWAMSNYSEIRRTWGGGEQETVQCALRRLG